MAEKSIIIIGAGLSGLSAGSYGQMNGYRTHIVEHHSEPGGVATAWKNGDYLIDGGIHYLMGHRPGQACYDLYRELVTPTIATILIRHLCSFHRRNHREVALVSDQTLPRLTLDLKNLAPSDARLIDQLYLRRASDATGRSVRTHENASRN